MSVTRAFTRRYILALSSVALLVLSTQALVQSVLVQLRNDSRVVNIAGRQRMLSQRLSKNALKLERNPQDATALQELDETLALWERSHNGLQNGDADLGLTATDDNSPTVRALFANIEPNYQAMREAAVCLVRPASSCPAPKASIEVILENEALFLRGMDTIVFQYDAESRRRVNVVRNLEFGLVTATIILLVLEALFIFRPAIQRLGESFMRLQDLNQTLEARVEARTQALNQANLRLQGLNQEIRTFASGISHDLRSPIASSQGFLQEIQLAWQDLCQALPPADYAPIARAQTELEEAFAAFGQALKRMDDMTRSVMQLARDGYRDLKIEALNPAEVVAEVLNLQSAAAKKSQADIRVHALPATLWADRLALTQILSNLLGNALKYRHPERPLTVDIGGETQGDEVVLYMRDNGRGIAESEQGQVFRLFRRGAQTEGIEGTGMGLYVVQSSAERQNGRVWLQSKEGEGTTFYVALSNKPPLLDNMAN